MSKKWVLKDSYFVYVEEASMSGGISLKPSDAVQSSSVIQSGNVLIKEVRVSLWDYNGKISSPIVALRVAMETEEGEQIQQYYSAGDPKFFVPSDDGRKFVPVQPSAGLNSSTNAVMFLTSLVNAGFPEDKIADDVSVFDGTRVFVSQVPQPKRTGLVGQAEGGNKTILIAQKILSLPWDAGNGAGVGVGAAKVLAGPKAAKSPTSSAPAVGATTAAPSVGDQGALVGKAIEGMIAILGAKGGQVTKAQLAQEAFKHFAKDSDRTALVQLMFKDEFLKQEGAPWAFDGTTVSLG